MGGLLDPIHIHKIHMHQSQLHARGFMPPLCSKFVLIAFCFGRGSVGLQSKQWLFLS